MSSRYACSLLRPDMRQIIISLDSQDILDLENQGNKENIAKVHDFAFVLPAITQKFLFSPSSTVLGFT